MNTNTLTQSDKSELGQLLTDCQDITKAIDLQMQAFVQQWVKDGETRKKVLEEFRLWRMAVTTEQSKLIQGCADVRKFFLGDDHEKELARLKEFIELMERLHKLQQAGILDTFADAILKLA